MIEKSELLRQVKVAYNEGLISEKELTLITRSEKLANSEDQHKESTFHFAKKIDMSEILYYVGGAIVSIGIAILVAQNWTSLNNVAKILLTLGSGLTAFVVGLALRANPKTKGVSIAFHLISVVVIPAGVAVTFDVLGMDLSNSGILSIIAFIMFLFYFISYKKLGNLLFLVFAIIFGTYFYYLISDYFIRQSVLLQKSKISNYLVFAQGASYIALGYSFVNTNKARLTRYLYGIGIMVFLSSALALGGFGPRQSLFWNLLFPALVLGTLYISTKIKSSAFLAFGTLYLMIYILKITAEYFSESLGWPITLIFSGLLLIGSGYMFIYLRKTYLTGPKPKMVT